MDIDLFTSQHELCATILHHSRCAVMSEAMVTDTLLLSRGHAIALDVALGLTYLHREGIVHVDIK